MLKVRIPKLGDDAQIEQPHSQIAHNFKARPPGKPLCYNVGNASATYIYNIGDFIANLAENATVLTERRYHQIVEFLKDIHRTDLLSSLITHRAENGTECNDMPSCRTDTTRLKVKLSFSVSIRHQKCTSVENKTRLQVQHLL